MTVEMQLLVRLDQIIQQSGEVVNSAFWVQVDSFERKQFVEPAKLESLRTATLSFIEMIYGRDHTHYREVSRYSEGQNFSWKAEAMAAILQVIRQEIAGGWFVSMRRIVAAEVFSDFLEMAEHLLDQGYKDPAAVMIGSVLEEHLRQLAARNEITVTFEKDGKQVPKKADTLNAELAKAEVYNKLDQKGVTAWLDLRNNAAHGKYTEYTKEQVQLMLQGVLDFVRRVSLK
jgi:hypothetical protein